MDWITRFLLFCFLVLSSCDKNEYLSRTYQGHRDNNKDLEYFVRMFPQTVPTRLNDCQTCHKTGDVAVSSDGIRKTVTYNPCSYCHLIPSPNTQIVEGAPEEFEDTLNEFGSDYLKAGRTFKALETIQTMDSDHDSYSNLEEIRAFRYPGDSKSYPGKPATPVIKLTMKDFVEKLKPYQQALLINNTHNIPPDQYAQYSGFKVKDILGILAIDITKARDITMFAPDGYSLTFSVQDVTDEYPPSRISQGLGTVAPPAGLGKEKGFVDYPPSEYLPERKSDSSISESLSMMIAHSKNGKLFDIAYLTKAGKLEGEGPYRLIVPQKKPGSPDRAKDCQRKYNDGWDFDPSKDHNAGKCIRGILAIRINPMPSEYEEFDWKNGGFSLLEEKSIIVYGFGITYPNPEKSQVHK